MAQCQSKVFFPDDPAQSPQFNGCPRQAETVRRASRIGDTSKGEPKVIICVVKLCLNCARMWDGRDTPPGMLEVSRSINPYKRG